ncbi:hypothetical protein ZWY2020_055636 [Hordeum vulgare]|nr:hypothetical protein ZWY2020_055636 [Hordeum vulgare]
MNPSAVGMVEEFGLLAADMWAPERPTYLYNTLFNMWPPYPYMDQDAVQLEAGNDVGGDDQSHIIDLIEKFLEEVDRDDEAAMAAEESAGQGNGSAVDDGVLRELPERDVAAADGDSTVGETLAAPVVASQSESGNPVTGGGTRGRSGLPRQRRGRRGSKRPKNAPSVSLAGAGEACSAAVLNTASADGFRGFPGNNSGSSSSRDRRVDGQEFQGAKGRSRNFR